MTAILTNQRGRNRKTAAQRSSNINHRPSPTCIKPPQPFPQKAQETRTTQKKLQRKKNCNAKKKCNAKTIAVQKKLQCKQKLQKGPGPGGPVVRAFDPSPYPNPPQTTPIHIFAFNNLWSFDYLAFAVPAKNLINL